LVKITRRNLLAASAAFAVTPALAQPAKNMTLVVPFPPGGSTDALARLLQSHLQTRLGRTVLVENKSGAAGSLGAVQVAKSAPDGATFLVTFDSHAVIPSILEKPGLDVEKDLMPVFLVGTAPYVVAANAERPYKTFADVIAACKANPGAVKYASVGIGTLGHLAMTVLGKKAGVEIPPCAVSGWWSRHERRARRPCRSHCGIGRAGHSATRHQHAASDPANGA
jgi:tripartite-type tricarboxylate transporter receptor subunit TctC